MVTALKTARSWSTPPVTFLLGVESGWGDERNRALSMALTLLESETCKGCGTPMWWGHSTRREIVFDVDSTTCYGCAELEKANKDAKRNPPGETKFVVPRNVWDGEALPSRHECYAERK